MNNIDPNTFVPTAATAKAYELCKAEIQEAARGPLTPLNIDVPHATQVMLSIVGNVAPYQSEIAKNGSCDQPLIQKLEVYTQALVYTHSLHQYTESTVPDLEQLFEGVIALRKTFAAELDFVESRGALREGSVTLLGTTGYNATAVDLRTICIAFLQNWERVGSHIGGTKERVDAAMAAADNFLAMASKAQQVQEKLRGTAALRTAAWTLAFKAYRETLRAMQCVRFHQDDVKDFVPTLYDHGNTPKKGKKDAPTNPSAPTDPLAPSPAPSPLPSPSNGGSTPNIPVVPVFPSKPFQ